MSTTIQVRIDDELKMKSDELFKDLGTDTTSAIRIFLAQAVANNGFPFEIRRVSNKTPYAPLTEEELFQKLEKSEKEIVDEKCSTSQETLSKLRKKYEL